MILLRHPTPDIDPGICYGRTDLDIAASGPDEIAGALAQTPPLTRIFASPARRCRKLAEELAARDALAPVYDERLWEMDMGEWEGMAWKDIPRQASAYWLKDPINRPPPGGECFADLQARVSACVGRYVDDEFMTTAIVCHAGPIRAIQMAWQNLTFHQAFSSTPPYASPVRIARPKKT